MLNPFITDSPRKSKNTTMIETEEQIAQHYGSTITRSAVPNHWIWRLGSLLIRIGTKLTKEGSTISNANRNA